MEQRRQNMLKKWKCYFSSFSQKDSRNMVCYRRHIWFHIHRWVIYMQGLTGKSRTLKTLVSDSWTDGRRESIKKPKSMGNVLTGKSMYTMFMSSRWIESDFVILKQRIIYMHSEFLFVVNLMLQMFKTRSASKGHPNAMPISITCKRCLVPWQLVNVYYILLDNARGDIS